MLNAAWEIAWALATVLVVYVLAASSSRSVAIGVVLLLIPFQTVDTRFATSSVLVAYAMAGVLLLGGDIKVRLLPSLGLIVLAYFVSLSQADRELMGLHAIYVFQFFSCLVVFLLAYNFARIVESQHTVVSLLLAINVLVLFYCLLQVFGGADGRFAPFGIDALAFNKNRAGNDARLVGPFDNPGSTAGYFTIMILVCAAELMIARGWRKTLVQLLILFNLVGLVATGNRAGLLVLVVMFPVLLFVFRQTLGTMRSLQYLIGGVLVLSIAATVAVNYTAFGRMLDRMEEVTETENGVPSTRAVSWPIAVERIKQHPMLGEGPFFVDPGTAATLGWLRDRMTPYPHSLYLFLLRTVGIVGLVAVLWLFIAVWNVARRALAHGPLAAGPAAFLRTGIVVIPAFLIAQVTLEFNRLATIDYAQFIFALMGLFVGVADSATRPPTRA